MQFPEAQNQSQYEFCYVDNDALSLVITKKPKILYDILYKQATFVWIADSHQKLKYSQGQIQSKAEVKIEFVKSVTDLIQKYGQQKERIFLICHRSHIKQIQTLVVPVILAYKISCIVFYGDNKPSKKRLKFDLIDISYVDNEQKAIKSIKDKKESYASGNFINFIVLNQQIWNSNILIKTMLAMIKQKTNVQKIMVEFEKLGKLCYGQYQEQFAKQYQNNDHLQGNKAIQWYTKQSFLYRFVNRILRISKDPTCIFIIQPYFRDLFKNIQKLYQEQQQKRFYTVIKNTGEETVSYKKFMCFRGGSISEDEIKFFKENINSFIQNLGFVSTSRSESIARNFINNALFVIEVEDNERNALLDYGFADLNQYSQESQAQILFNPLNSFKIVDFEQKNNFYKISLKYGEMARVAVSEKNKLSQKQLNLKWLAEYQIKENKKYVRMDHVLIQNGYNLQGSQQFRDIFFKIATNCSTQHKISFLFYAYYLRGRVSSNKGDYKTAELQYANQLEILEIMLSSKYQKQVYKQMATSLNNIGYSFDNLGEHKKAIEYYQKCQMIQKKTIGQNHPQYARTLNNLGFSFEKLNENQQAIEYYQRCQLIQKTTIGQNHPEYAKILNNLGAIFFKLNQNQKALEYFKRSQEIQKQTIGEHHPEYLLVKKNLGMIFQKLDKPQLALEYFKTCEKMMSQTLEEYHPNYTFILKYLCLYLVKLGKHQQAIQYLKKCQNIERQTNGQNHPEYVMILGSLGVSFFQLGQYQKAMEYYKRCQKIQKQTISQKDPNYASTLNSLSLCFDKLNQFQQELEYLQKCLYLYRQIYGENNEKYARILNNLGMCLFKLGQYQKAMEYLNNSLKIQKQKLTSNSPLFAITLNNLGMCFEKFGQYQQGIKYYQKCQQIKRQIYGINDPQYAQILNNLGMAYNVLGQHKKAVEFLQRCEKIQRQKLGINHPNYAITLNNLGTIFYNLGQNQKSMEFFQRCQKIQKQKLGENSSQYAQFIHNLAMVLYKFGQYQKSLKYQQKYFKIQKQKNGQNHPSLTKTIIFLAHNLHKLKNYQKAAEYFKICEKIQRKALGENHPEYARIVNNYGMCLYQSGEFEKAVKNLKRCQKLRSQILGENHPDYLTTLKNLIRAYSKVGSVSQQSQYYFNKLEQLEKRLTELGPLMKKILTNQPWDFSFYNELLEFVKGANVDDQISQGKRKKKDN